MHRHQGPALAFLPLLAAALASCGGTSSTTGPSPSVAATGSHNAGRDCMSCHGPAGDGPTWTVAGTVYRSDGTTAFPGATIRLTTAPDGGGSVVLELVSDGSGNFYTGRAVSFGGGLFADAAGTGARRAMQDALTRGSCNGCHDASNRLRAD